VSSVEKGYHIDITHLFGKEVPHDPETCSKEFASGVSNNQGDESFPGVGWRVSLYGSERLSAGS